MAEVLPIIIVVANLNHPTCYIATLQCQSDSLGSVARVCQSRPLHLKSVTLVKPIIRDEKHVVEIQDRDFRDGVVRKVVREIRSNNSQVVCDSAFLVIGIYHHTA